jgi:hypothetical protein
MSWYVAGRVSYKSTTHRLARSVVSSLSYLQRDDYEQVHTSSDFIWVNIRVFARVGHFTLHNEDDVAAMATQ